jgi:hypothetical protein
MSNNSQTSTRWLFRLGVTLIFSLLLLARIGYGQQQAVAVAVNQEAILQGAIQIQPVQSIGDDQAHKIQPGTPVKLSVLIQNKGLQPSPKGEIYLRYAFAKPLHNEETSLIFETEKVSLPSIDPGKSIELKFDATHRLPSLLDFVRDDWTMREYQAIAVFGKEEKMLATLAITFSAYYYPGIRKEFPTKILGE